MPFQRSFQQTVPQGQKHVLPQFVIDLINLVIVRLFDWLLHLWLGSPCPVILLVLLVLLALLLCAEFFEGLFLVFLLFFNDWFLFCVYFLCLVEKWCLIKLLFRLFQFRNRLCLSYLFWELLFLDFRLLI